MEYLEDEDGAPYPEAVQEAFRQALAEAWDFGYSCGLGDYGKDFATQTTAANPYLTIEEFYRKDNNEGY